MIFRVIYFIRILWVIYIGLCFLPLNAMCFDDYFRGLHRTANSYYFVWMSHTGILSPGQDGWGIQLFQDGTVDITGIENTSLAALVEEWMRDTVTAHIYQLNWKNDERADKDWPDSGMIRFCGVIEHSTVFHLTKRARQFFTLLAQRTFCHAIG